ncbi:MAG: tetratricopeptide repeat-containing sensor histidine kinase [Balneolaceae bacterium]
MGALLKLTLLIFVFLYIPAEVVMAQPQVVDSLRNSLHYDERDSLEADTNTVLTLIKIAESFQRDEPDSIIKYAASAFELAERINSVSGMVRANQLLGIVYFRRGEYKKVYELGSTSISLLGSSGYQEERASLNHLMGLFHASQGSYERGLSYFFEARNSFEALGDADGVFRSLNNIGASYNRLGNNREALNIFLELDSLNALTAATISIPVNLGINYYELEDFEKAEQNLMRVIRFEDKSYDKRALGLTTFKLGEIYRERKQYSDALNYFNESIQIFDSLDNEIEKVQSLNGIALTYLELQELKNAEGYAQHAFSIASTANALPEKNISSKTLFEIYSALGNPEKALDYHMLHKSYSDSLHNDEVSKAVGRLEAEYEYEKLEENLRTQQQVKNLRNAEQVADRTYMLVIAIALLIIAIVISSFLYRNSMIRKSANNLLQEKNKEIEHQAARLHEMNEIKDHLFSIISHDLRGPLSSLYGFITLNEMNALSKQDMQKLIPELADKFKYTSNLLNNLLNWAKSQLKGYKVVPKKFQIKTIALETQKLLAQKASEKSITVEINLDEVAPVYADKSMIDLVLLNFLSNAIKFTPNNGHINLTATEGDDFVNVCIQDNGVGISEEHLEQLFKETSFFSTEGTNDEKGTGLGLMLCKDFVQKNKGTLWAESKINEGSTFCFTLPKAENN